MKKIAFIISSLFIITSCSNPSKSTQTTPSKSGSRKIEEKKLENGLQIVYVHDDKLPEFGVHLVVKVGSKDDPKNKAGLSHITANLLEKGTRSKSAQQVLDLLAELGADMNTAVAEDLTMFSIDGLSPSRASMINIFTESLFQPAFQESELARLKQNLIAEAINRVDEPSEFTSSAWPAFLFSGSSYALPVTGTPKNIRQIQRKDVLKHYLKFFHPNNSLLAVVGQFSKDDQNAIEKLFGEWKSADVPSSQFVPPEVSEGVKIRFINKPKAVQAQLRMGFPSIDRSNPDYIAATVANTILGDAFYSRLMHRIRTELGLTYGIGSDITNRLHASTLEIRASTKNAGLKQTIDESILQIQKMVDEGVSDKEVEDAKGYMLGQYPRMIERSNDLAKKIIVYRAMGRPDSDLFEYETQVKKVKPVDVNTAIKKYFSPKNIKIFVYGDAQTGMAQLKSYKPSLVPVNKAFETL